MREKLGGGPGFLSLKPVACRKGTIIGKLHPPKGFDRKRGDNEGKKENAGSIPQGKEEKRNHLFRMCRIKGGKVSLTPCCWMATTKERAEKYEGGKEHQKGAEEEDWSARSVKKKGVLHYKKMKQDPVAHSFLERGGIGWGNQGKEKKEMKNRVSKQGERKRKYDPLFFEGGSLRFTRATGRTQGREKGNTGHVWGTEDRRKNWVKGVSR